MGFLDRLRGSLNPVTIGLTLLLVAGVYAGWKFIPPYWQAQKVDNALSAVKWEASKIKLVEHDGRDEELLARLREKLGKLGIEQRYLNVYFAPNYTSVHADYYVFVHHLFGKTTKLEFRRKLAIPRDIEY